MKNKVLDDYALAAVTLSAFTPSDVTNYYWRFLSASPLVERQFRGYHRNEGGVLAKRNQLPL